MDENTNSSNRGFGSMDETRVEEIASKGGKAKGSAKNLTKAARSKGGKRSHGGGRTR
jgi:hypothetical protein